MARNSHVARCALSHQIFLGLLQGKFISLLSVVFKSYSARVNECATAVYVPKLLWVSLPKTV